MAAAARSPEEGVPTPPAALPPPSEDPALTPAIHGYICLGLGFCTAALLNDTHPPFWVQIPTYVVAMLFAAYLADKVKTP